MLLGGQTRIIYCTVGYPVMSSELSGVSWTFDKEYGKFTIHGNQQGLTRQLNCCYAPIDIYSFWLSFLFTLSKYTYYRVHLIIMLDGMNSQLIVQPANQLLKARLTRWPAVPP